MSAVEGFLSTGFTKTVTRIRQDYSSWFDVIHKCNRLAMDVLPRLKSGTTNDQKLLEAGLYGRAIQSFQAVILLAERGMSADARTVLRSLAETSILQRKVAQDATFVEKMVEHHQYHRRTLANALLRDKPTMAELDPEQVRKLQATIEDIDAAYPGRKPADINLADIATAIGGMALYNVIFRPTSGDAVHADLDAIIRHLVPDEKGNISGLRFGPDTSDLTDTLSLAVSVLLHVIDAGVESFELNDFRSRLGACVKGWKSLTSSMMYCANAHEFSMPENTF